MARPKLEHPTPAELEVLHVLWQRGGSTVRDVMEALDSTRRGRAYTSVMSLLNLMCEKGLATRQPKGRAFVYEAHVAQDKTLGRMAGDFCRRTFAGSTSALVAHILAQGEPSVEELRKIRRVIDAYLD